MTWPEFGREIIEHSNLLSGRVRRLKLILLKENNLIYVESMSQLLFQNLIYFCVCFTYFFFLESRSHKAHVGFTSNMQLRKHDFELMICLLPTPNCLSYKCARPHVIWSSIFKRAFSSNSFVLSKNMLLFSTLWWFPYWKTTCPVQTIWLQSFPLSVNSCQIQLLQLHFFLIHNLICQPQKKKKNSSLTLKLPSLPVSTSTCQHLTTWTMVTLLPLSGDVSLYIFQ